MKIVLNGAPFFKKRHRCACRNGKPLIYDPQVTKEMAVVKHQMLNEWNRIYESENRKDVKELSNVAWASCLEVFFSFYFPVKPSDSQSKKNEKLWGFQLPNEKPDFDNLQKFYADCGNGILWKDDCQIVISHSNKFYDENPRTEIEIMVKKEVNINPKAKNVFMVFGPNKLKEFLVDVTAFMALPSSKIDQIIAASNEPDKESIFLEAAALLSDFALKYSDDLKKIAKSQNFLQEEARKNAFLSSKDQADLHLQKEII